MKRWLTRIAWVVAGLLALILVAVLVLNLISFVRQRKTYDIQVASLDIPTDVPALLRGHHLVTAVGACQSCHEPDLGGRILVNNPLIGSLPASNLTSGDGGIAKAYSTEQWVRAIRHGVGRDGRSLIFMPSDAFQAFDDRDLAAIIAFVRAVPPVNRVLPPKRVGPLSRVLHVVARFPLLPAELVDHAKKHAIVTPGLTAEYGEYVATGSSCRACHGLALAGNANPTCPNITRGRIGHWTEADFTRVLRKGKRPDGSMVTDEMPWKAFAGMSDEEVGALWRYQQSLPAVAPAKK